MLKASDFVSLANSSQHFDDYITETYGGATNSDIAAREALRSDDFRADTDLFSKRSKEKFNGSGHFSASKPGGFGTLYPLDDKAEKKSNMSGGLFGSSRGFGSNYPIDNKAENKSNMSGRLYGSSGGFGSNYPMDDKAEKKSNVFGGLASNSGTFGSTNPIKTEKKFNEPSIFGQPGGSIFSSIKREKKSSEPSPFGKSGDGPFGATFVIDHKLSRKQRKAKLAALDDMSDDDDKSF